MKTVRFFNPRFLSALLVVFGLTFGPVVQAQSTNKSKQENAPIVDGTAERLHPRDRKTAKEKEYAELAGKIRKSDESFEKTWRAAKSDERQKLRSERIEKLQPTLGRMHQLALEIRKERVALDGESAPKPVPVAGPLTAPDEVKGKTESELRQMGIAVGALHQKPESGSGESHATAAAGK
jgi:hypothetical protein